jgi:glucokinase
VWAAALDAGDKVAQELIDEAVEALGAGIASAQNLLDLDAVVVGGGLGTKLGKPYVEKIAAAAQPHIFVSDRPPAFVLTELGDDGGALGAALLVSESG